MKRKVNSDILTYKSISRKLDNKDISSNDSKYIIDKIIEIQKMQNTENTGYKNFLLKTPGVIVIFVLGIFVIKKKFDIKSSFKVKKE